ncbi:MAG: hypothetical protein ACP5DX_10975 [Paracoccaceae bacterium]
MRAGLGALLLCATAASAEISTDPEIAPAPYDEIAALTRGRVDFDLLPRLPEPGHNLDHGIAFAGGRLGERFAGQRLEPVEQAPGLPHDRAAGAPETPLAVIDGAPGQNLSVSFHRAFLSNALYPLGPRGYPEAEARGEGSAAFFFTRDSCAFALRLHTEYLDDLGTNADHTGEVSFTFYARDGRMLGRETRAVPGGISSHGFQTADGAARIAGVLVENLDPGGIALDDIRFGCIPRLG